MNEILNRYLHLHSELGQQVDAKDRETFDIKHRQIWGDCDVDLRDRMSELEAKPKPTDDEILELANLRERYIFQS